MFENNILGVSEQIEQMIQTTYSNINYISADYLNSFMTNLNQDITPLINTTKVDVGMYLKTNLYVTR